MGRPTAGRAAGATNWVLIGVAEPRPAREAMSVSVSVGARMIERGGADGRREADFAVSSARRKRATAWGSRNHYGLLVDSRVHAEELARFEALVVRGPGADDCAIWKGAIGGDGYVSNRAVKKSVRQPFPMIAGCGTSTMVSAVRLVRSSRRTPRQQIQSSHRLASRAGRVPVVIIR